MSIRRSNQELAAYLRKTSRRKSVKLNDFKSNAEGCLGLYKAISITNTHLTKLKINIGARYGCNKGDTADTRQE